MLDTTLKYISICAVACHFSVSVSTTVVKHGLDVLSNTTFDAVATTGAIILGLVTYDCDFDQDESTTPCTPSVVFQVCTALKF